MHKYLFMTAITMALLSSLGVPGIDALEAFGESIDSKYTAATASTVQLAEPDQIKRDGKFRLAYDALMETFKAYVSIVVQTAGFILLAIGWVLTSDKARSYLGANHLARRIALGAIVVIAAIHLGVSWGYYKLSEKFVVLLDNLNYVEHVFYERYEITMAILWMNGLLNLVLFALLFTLVLGLGRPGLTAVSAGDST